MSLQDLPKTIANTALGLIRLPLELLERVIPGRGGDHRAGAARTDGARPRSLGAEAGRRHAKRTS